MYRLSAENWTKANKLGRTQFVLRYGVLGWGLPVAIVFSLIRAWLDGWHTFLPHLGAALILFPLVGILVGLIWWKRMEKDFGESPPG